uniref:Coiled-coil domain-containing protein 177 n=1 Tax=Elaeophora elaphi TaxID=1147741 RepID=A0A0R3S1I5_9BILA
MMEEMERALNATDQFLDIIAQDKNRLKDPNFMIHLMRVRQKHKKTFAVIDEVCDLSSTSKFSAASVKICHTDIIDQHCCVLSNSFNSTHVDDEKDAWIIDNERQCSRSVQSLVQTQKHMMHEKRRFEYAAEWLPQTANSASNTKDLPFRNFLIEFSKKQKEKREIFILRNERNSIRTSYSQRFLNELMEKKKIEEMEEKKRITFLRNRAREVPRSTYEPRYQQLCEKEEHCDLKSQARQLRHQKAAEMLKKVRFPRMSAKFGPENFHLRRCISAEASDWNKREAFKAKDVPLSVYVPPYKDEIQACKRARRKTERAAELIRTSHAPPGLEKHAIQAKVQHRLRHGKYCMDKEPKRNPCYSRTVPNFKKLHEQLLNKLEKAMANRSATVVTPFCFQTEERTRSHKCNHENLTPRINRRSYSTGNLREYNGPGIRLNHASLLRNEANRIRAQKMENDRNCSQKFWELMRKRSELARIKLKQKLATEITTICDIKRRLKEKKIKQQERADEYRNELEEIKRRVRTRALIVEQQEMLIRMQRYLCFFPLFF